MTSEKAREYKATASELRNSGAFHASGETFRKVAFEYLGEGGSTWTASGFHYLLQASMCFRLAGSERKLERTRDLCVTLALDQAESHTPYPVDSDEKKEKPWYRYDLAIEGAWYEYAGDVRVIADDPAAETAYDNAREIYIETGDLDLSYVEQPHNRLFDFYRYVSKGVGYDEPSSCVDDMFQIATDATLTDWLAYKRDTLPKFVDVLSRRGEWTW